MNFEIPTRQSGGDLMNLQLTSIIKAPRARVYQALTDAQAVATWMVPEGMTSRVHHFDAREGGAFRISLTYTTAEGVGKSTAHTDTYHGHFVRLVPDEQVIQTMEFETDQPDMMGEMTTSFTLNEYDGGTKLIAAHDQVPPVSLLLIMRRGGEWRWRS